MQMEHKIMRFKFINWNLYNNVSKYGFMEMQM